jgi:type IV pilus assembly protein PilQ
MKMNNVLPERRPRRSLVRALAALLILLQPGSGGFLGAAAAAGEARLKNVLYENGTLRLRMDKNAAYRVFSLSKPPRLVVELSDTIHAGSPYEASVDDGILKRIRSAQFKSAPEKVTRVVLDMTRLVPFEAVQEGNDLLVRLTPQTLSAGSAAPAKAEAAGVPAASVSMPAHKSLPPSLMNTAEASVTAAAAPAPERSSSRRKPTDLLSAIPNHPVTIDFDNADIRDVVRVLSEMSDLNMIYGADVRGNVTIHLDQVPLREAFDTILTMQGLVAQQMGNNVIRILTPETLSADRSRSVTTYKTFTLNYAKAADVAPHLALVRVSPNGRVTIDEQSNTLVVMDTTEGIAASERMIADLDRKPQQVMIEAKMVEIVLSDNLDLGITWEYSNIKQSAGGTRTIGVRERKTSANADAGSIGFVNDAGGELTNPSPVGPQGSSISSLGPLERGTGVALPGPQQAAITFGFINNTDLLTATLNALAQKGQTKILSSPKVITVNNKEAKIQSGSRIPFSITTVAATGVATQSFQFVDVGIILTVTPTISADERIRLEVKPEVSFPGSVGPAGPEINTRNAETEVLIRDGETLVIGGLIDEQMRESAQKVPLLGDIPVLGAFFRSTSDSKRRSELLVFVTPTIIRE